MYPTKYRAFGITKQKHILDYPILHFNGSFHASQDGTKKDEDSNRQPGGSDQTTFSKLKSLFGVKNQEKRPFYDVTIDPIPQTGGIEIQDELSWPLFHLS